MFVILWNCVISSCVLDLVLDSMSCLLTDFIFEGGIDIFSNILSLSLTLLD
jgi:hypothetical protein